MESWNLLIVDDDVAVLEIMWNIVHQIEGLHVEKTNNPHRALEILKRQPFHMLLTDLVMPDLNGLDLMKKAREIHPEISIAVVTGFGDLELAMGAIKAGAYGYVHKPFRPEELALIIHNMLEKQEILKRLAQQDEEIEHLKGELNSCQLSEGDLRQDLESLQEKLDAIGIPSDKAGNNFMEAINRAAQEKVKKTLTNDLARELTNLDSLLEEKKITEDEFKRFREHILKRTYGEG